MATRDKQLNIRCSDAFKQTLDQLTSQKEGYYYGWTQADILHDLVKQVAKYCLPRTNWYKEIVNEI